MSGPRKPFDSWSPLTQSPGLRISSQAAQSDHLPKKWIRLKRTAKNHAWTRPLTQSPTATRNWTTGSVCLRDGCPKCSSSTQTPVSTWRRAQPWAREKILCSRARLRAAEMGNEGKPKRPKVKNGSGSGRAGRGSCDSSPKRPPTDLFQNGRSRWKSASFLAAQYPLCQETSPRCWGGFSSMWFKRTRCMQHVLHISTCGRAMGAKTKSSSISAGQTRAKFEKLASQGIDTRFGNSDHPPE